MNNFWKNLKKPIVGLAPMDGITDYPMREIQVQISKPDVMYTEFISVEGFIRNEEIFKRKLSFEIIEKPIVVQLFGHTPEAFYEAILMLKKYNFDGIDLNMGCPAKNVVQRGSGGALIGNYNLAEEIINHSLKAISEAKLNIPLSIKTRIGQKEIVTNEWFSFLSGFPFSEVTVHGRLLSQGNSGEVNWEEIKKANKILKEKKIVCLGNGGIKTKAEALNYCDKYDLDGVLIGLAACGNPWVFSGHKPTTKDVLDTIIKQAKLVTKFYDQKGFITFRKHLSWYPKSFENCVKLKVELLKAKNLEEVEKIILEFEKEAKIN